MDKIIHKELLGCAGYCQLLTDVRSDEQKDPNFVDHDYYSKLNWTIERARHYAERVGVSVERILDGWEAERNYWYMSYYQDANQPLLDGAQVRVFQKAEDLSAAIDEFKFRCPMCGGVSSSPYRCDSGDEMAPGKVCDWKVYGLFRDLGKGIFCYVLDLMRGEQMFMPLDWEEK